VEVQILGDGRGHCVHLGSRDCSVQRRYQKLIEEAPAPLIAPQLLADLADSAVTAMAELGYESAATLEFLYVNEQFYFLEVNTRLQVEHPVTEQISGHDIVSSQLFIAQNKTLPFEQKDVELHGHALELRILAEDGEGQPSPGVIQCLELPGGPGVRVDSHLAVGYRVPHQYDSLIAKLVIWATDRDTAIARARQALAEFKIEGVQTNIARLLQLISAPDFATVNIHTTWAPK
jgi:acetyl/propionyl-CoA carboxylase alpha subunit